MQAKGFRMMVPVLALALGAGGCLVTASKYEEKTKEADSLRNALAATNRENTTLEEEYVAIREQLDDEKTTNETLSMRIRDQEEELRRVREELESITRSYEGTRITREELISQLLEKEKATGKRIQELSSMAQLCDMGQEKLRRERDMLLGRIERIREDRLRETRRRDIRFAELSKTFAGISSQIFTALVGPAMLVRLPDKICFLKGKPTLTNTGKQVIEEVGKTVLEFPEAVIIITAEGKSKADEIRAFLTENHSLPRRKVSTSVQSGGGDAELMLVIP